MRKRLIEKFTKAKEGSLGYTLTELLVVIGIIALVCAIAIPSVIAISKALRFKQANDYAKSIFMAAQQNLTEMRSDGGLVPVKALSDMSVKDIAGFPDEYEGEYYYTYPGHGAFDLVLPAGSIDSAVRGKQIIIEYNPTTGNVYSVFYSEEDESIREAYEGAAGLPREDMDARKGLMLGYYDGSGLNSSQIELEKTQAMVEFVNGEEGLVRVLVPMPDSYFEDLTSFAEALQVDLTITGDMSITSAPEGFTAAPVSISIKPSGVGLTAKGGYQMVGTNSVYVSKCYVGADGKTIVIEYPLDSLAAKWSFANHAAGNLNTASLTTVMEETEFAILPGENITIQANVTFEGVSSDLVEIDPGILAGVNPMFEYLQPSGSGKYVLAVSNGRNLQNLNALAPSIASQVESVVFTSDIYWNDTVSYYTAEYGGSFATDEAPARHLPYFVPIHHEDLFGTAKFIFPGDDSDGGLGSIIQDLLDKLTGGIVSEIFGGYSNPNVPTLTDEMDTVNNAVHASIQGNGHKVYNLNIDSTEYTIPNDGKFYATGTNQLIDYCFTGLFGYVNTPIDDLHVVNPIVKGHEFEDKETTILVYEGLSGLLGIPTQKKAYVYNNPATGALVGAGGFNTLITDCSTYIDKDARGYMALNWGPYAYSVSNDQNWYGVSGEGAVGGLVGYAKSHRSVTGELANDKAHLAFSKCFAAVPVSGNMRGNGAKHFGYSNGVGAFIGNSQLTNFYNCYASGEVLATGSYVQSLTGNGIISTIADVFGFDVKLLYNGRTSMGAGGFVGTSHGTRYTNCFATGSVSATGSDKGAGGFVGFMSIDETRSYGNDSGSETEIAQRTIFTNCYSVGMAVSNSKTYENFSGANGRIVLDLNQSAAYVIGDYYQLYAPVYKREGREPNYTDIYFYRDSYFLSNYHIDENSQANSSACAEAEPYSTFENLVGVHTQDSDWTKSQIQAIKDIQILGNYYTYEDAYFDSNGTLEARYKVLYDEGYSPAEWVKATASTTHPYALTTGSVYPFTKLVDMDYYGDWPSKPSDVGMAYYEAYEDAADKNHFFFDKEHENNASLNLKDDAASIVVEDGYAIFSANNAKLNVTIGDTTKTLTASGETYTVSNKSYHVFYLTDALMNEKPANGKFYVQVTAQHEGADESYTMYFNPEVAISHVNPTDGKTDAVEPDAAPARIYVRSARQLKAVASMENFWGANQRYIQQLNIDASKYAGWDDNDCKIGSIGDADNNFNGSYSAGYTDENNAAKRYAISGFVPEHAGFFGVIGDSGKVEDLIVKCGAVTAGSTSTIDVADAAIVAGWNKGTVENVKVVLSGTVKLTGKTSAGILAGYSSGKITDCEVAVAEDETVSVTIKAPDAGGFVGKVVGTEAKKASVSDCELTLNGTLTIQSATNAGGMIGSAEHLTAEKLEVTLGDLAATATYAGGLVGKTANSEFTTATVKLDAAENNNENGCMAGAVGNAKDTKFTAVNVDAGSLSGKVAAGFMGSGENADAQNSTVKVENVHGTAMAAGVAGSIGSQSVFNGVTVDLTGSEILSEGDAAGYAVEIKGEATVQKGSVALSGTKITGTTSAAGYACTVSGDVDTGTVTGKGSIESDGSAAGFAITMNGTAAGSHVSPAKNNDAYKGNSNENLKVIGKKEAAGFAVTVSKSGAVRNSYVLCDLTGSAGTAYGFVGSNGGEISGCMANVDITGGYAFAGSNAGNVVRCYGWYSDGSIEKTDTVATVNGNCMSCYFVDMKPVKIGSGTVNSVTLYAHDKKVSTMTTTALSGAVDDLAGSTYTWYKAGTYDEWPYTEKPEGLEEYPYPMLARPHYGDWTIPPQYAYGVAYYETYDGYIKLHLKDLSNAKVTEEGEVNGSKNIDTVVVIDSTNYADITDGSVKAAFNKEGDIKTAGYAVFRNPESKDLNTVAGSEKMLTYSLTYGERVFAYDFYPLKTDGAKNGIVEIAAGKSGTSGATVNSYFADAINLAADKPYVVRTPEQLANVAKVPAGNFKQTHDITVKENFTTVEGFTGSYDGGECQIVATDATNGWMNGTNKVTKLSLRVGNIGKSLFGNITEEVSLIDLTVGDIGAEGSIAEATKKFTVTNAVSVGAVNGKLFGAVESAELKNGITMASVADGKKAVESVTGSFVSSSVAVTNGIGTDAAVFGAVSGSVNGGTDKAMSLTVGGSVNGSLVDTVSGNGAVKLGDFTTNNEALPGYVLKSISGGSFTIGDVNVGNVTQMFGGMSGGSITTGAISAKNVTTLFGDVKTVTVNGNISADAVSTQIFGSVSGIVDVKGTIGADSAVQVFGDVTSGSVTSGKITVDGNVDKVFGNVESSGSVTVNGIQAKSVGTWVFGYVKGTVKIGNSSSLAKIDITGTGNVSQVFGDVTAGVTADGIDIDGTLSGYVIKSAANNADVSTGAVTIGKIGDGMVLGGASGGSVTFGDITIGAAAEAALAAEEVVTEDEAGNTAAEGGEGVAPAVEVPAGDVEGGSTGTTGSTTEPSTTPTTPAASKIGTLFGDIKGGATVSGAKITPNAALTGNLFKSVTGSATVQNFKVTTTTMDDSLVGGTLEGTLSGLGITADSISGDIQGVIVDGMEDGNIQNCVVDVDTITSDATAFGGITGNAAGAISGCEVTASSISAVNADTFGGIVAENGANTLSGNSVTATIQSGAGDVGGIVGSNGSGALTNNSVDVTLNVSGASTVGGLAGVNGGAVSGGTVDADITYTGSDAAIIGGLVGENTGSLNGISVSGKITLGEGGSVASGSKIGGAVGEDGITTAAHGTDSVEYKNVVSSVTLGSNFGLTNSNERACPAGKGAVGMFVGYVHSGTFDTCSSTAGNSDYQFVGELNVNSNTLGVDAYGTTTKLDVDTSGTKTVSTSCEDTTDKDKSKIDTSVYSKRGTNTAIHTYTASLTECTYIKGETKMLQYIDNVEYFYTIDEDVTTHFKVGASIKMPEFSDKTTVDFSSFAGYKGQTKVLTNYYYKHSDGNYYQVSVTYTEEHKTGYIIFVPYDYYEHKCYLYISASESAIASSTWVTDYSLDDKNKTPGSTELYTIDLSGVTIANNKYLVVASGNALSISNADGSSVAAPAKSDTFTDKDSLHGAIFTKSGNTWTSDKWGGVLNLGTGNWFAAGSEVTGSVVYPNGCANKDSAVFNLAGGGQFLNYSNGTFSKGSSGSGNFNLYSVSETNHVHKLVYTYTNKYDQACKATAYESES